MSVKGGREGGRMQEGVVVAVEAKWGGWIGQIPPQYFHKQQQSKTN